MQFVDQWVAVLTKPKETYASEKGKSSLAEGAKHLAVAYGIMGLIYGLGIALFSASLTVIPGAGAIAGLGMAMIVVAPIMMAVFGIVASLIGNGIIWIIAKVLGGNGPFEQQFYLSSLYLAPIALLGLIPLVGMLAGLYGLYLLTLMLKEVHAFDTLKAVAVWIIPGIIGFIIMGAAVMTLIAAGAAGAGNVPVR
ncbi:YIP1 family protein [Candidatus Micrarchaeota archaeon]|nr:YIP1 family protein [Candidatus Micrarchaeota archaeon]